MQLTGVFMHVRTTLQKKFKYSLVWCVTFCGLSGLQQMSVLIYVMNSTCFLADGPLMLNCSDRDLTSLFISSIYLSFISVRGALSLSLCDKTQMCFI